MLVRLIANSLALAALVALWTPPAQAEHYRDEFNSFFNYEAAGGAVPVGTLVASSGPNSSWSGTYNEQNGGGPYNGSPYHAIFQANGTDYNGTPTPGELFIEDAVLHPNTDESVLGVGWESGKNNAPFLFKRIPSTSSFSAIMKIDAQTAGFWSDAGIVARVSGPTVGFGIGDALDPNESFVVTGSFRTDVDNPGNAMIRTDSIINGVGRNDVMSDAAPSGPTAPLPLWVRLDKFGPLFSAWSSTDGSTWLYATGINNGELDREGEALEVGPAFMMFASIGGATAGAAAIDFFDLSYSPGAVVEHFPVEWLPPAQSGGSGDWNVAANWSCSCVPNSNEFNVRLGSAISSPATVYTNQPITIRSLTFLNANTYAVSGGGSLTFQPDPVAQLGNPSIYVLQGSHEIQVPVILGTSDVDIAAAAGTRLDINNSLDLSSRQLLVSGAGRVNINSNLTAGAPGSIDNTGNLGGSGRVNGNLQNNGGTVNPGTSVGTLTVNGNFSQSATGKLNVELGGSGAGQFDKLAVIGGAILNGEIDVSLVNGFTPNPGNSFTIFTAFSITNAGIVLNASDIPLFSLAVGSASVTITFTGSISEPLAGDYNGDGMINAADYTVWRDKLGSAGPLLNEGASPGIVDQADYDLWRQNFGRTGGSAAGQGAAVPEPSALTIAVMLLICGAAVRWHAGDLSGPIGLL